MGGGGALRYPLPPMPRLLVLDVVGLTPKLLASGRMPRLAAHAARHGVRRLEPGLPAVTCSVQASMLLGVPPEEHGAVANGWYFRDLAEVWLWRQSVHLVDGGGRRPSVHHRWRERFGTPTAQLFWWWNLPSHADLSVTPRPTYHADGRKSPDVHSWPHPLRDRLTQRLGTFPLFSFWGPGAGIASTRWIVGATLDVLAEDRPGLTLAYLPHLDYDLQRFGPDDPRALDAAAAVDAEAGRLLDAAEAAGDLDVLVVSEYGLTPVHRAVEPNRALRRAGLLAAQPAGNGALLDPGNSRAFAVCDHQLAHVYVADPADVALVAELLGDLDGVGEVLVGAERARVGLDHPRSGEVVLLAERDAWFAYPYWCPELGDREPDFARTVDIHRKPGYDPCELFLDPHRPLLKARLGAKLLLKRLGCRVLFDPVPLDPSLVRGSHGLAPAEPADGPVWIGPERWAPGPHEAIPAHRALAGVAPAD